MNGNPVKPGGSSISKPTWWNAFECSTMSAFFVGLVGEGAVFKGTIKAFARVFAVEGRPFFQEVCMINYISSLVFFILLAVGSVCALLVALANPAFALGIAVVWFVASVFVSSSIKLAAQWEQGLVFRLGKYHSTRGPGLFFVIPLVDQVHMVDIRIRATDIPAQQVITKDNVPVTINGVFFFKVERGRRDHQGAGLSYGHRTVCANLIA